MRLIQTRGIALEAGSYISTGAVTGVHEAHVDDSSRVDFGPWGEIDLTLTALQPEWGRAKLSAG